MVTQVSSDLLPKIDAIRANPSAITRLVLKLHRSITDGKVIYYDATNPAILALETAITLSSAAMLRNEALSRKQYSSLAATPSDIYHHMSDEDYLDRFASPSRTSINQVFLMSDVKKLAVDTGDGSGTRKLTIPRHTEYLVGGKRFTLQYPIDIYVMSHGGVNVLYDLDLPSPILAMSTNRLNWGVYTDRGTDYIRIGIPVEQLVITTQIAQLNNVTGFNKIYNFENRFYYCRAFHKKAVDAQWEEIRTTHSDQVFDPNEPTILLRVLNQQLQVYLPQIYFNNGLVKDSLLLLIHTTEGALEMSLEGYKPSSFSAKYLDHLQTTTGVFSAPLMKMSQMGIFSDSAVTGGTNGLSFAELRERVITRGLSQPTTPITQRQLSSTLASLGYSLVSNLDNVTDRQFLATRALPAPSNESTVTGAGCAVHMFQSRIADLVSLPTVTDNGDLVTIKPKTVFKSVNGVYEVVPDALINNLLDPTITPPEQTALTVNESEYFYSPFYYVLDTSQDEFDVRPYSLDKPIVEGRFFVSENTGLLLSVSTVTQAIGVNPDGSGYILAVEVTGDETWNALAEDQKYLQLSFEPSVGTRVFIDGVKQASSSKEIYYFYLNTNYAVDKNHGLVLLPSQAPAPLLNEYDLVYVVKDHVPVGAAPSAIDSYVDTSTLPAGGIYLGATHEKLTIKIGDYLENLWTRSRTVVTEELYQRYVADIPAVYEATVYLRDAQGNIQLTYNSGTDEYEYTILHAIGDPVLVGGEPTYRHLAGDLVLDANGHPIPVSGSRGLYRQMDMLFIDGRYYFATSESTISYREEMVDLLIQWITQDIENISDRLLERTELFFSPKTTVGKLKGVIQNGQEREIEASQDFNVVIHLPQDKFDNEAFKASIALTVKKTLAGCLESATISLSDMVSKLAAVLGLDAKGVEVYSNVFGADKITVITMKDESMRPTVGKQLVALNNQTIEVQDSVNVTFAKHN